MRYCSGKPADLIGSICNPCKITPSYTGNNESNTNEFTLAQISKGDDIKIYKGTVPLEEPVSVVEAGVKVVPFVTEGQYQLSGGSAVIDEIEGGAHDAVITLRGLPVHHRPFPIRAEKSCCVAARCSLLQKVPSSPSALLTPEKAA